MSFVFSGGRYPRSHKINLMSLTNLICMKYELKGLEPSIWRPISILEQFRNLSEKKKDCSGSCFGVMQSGAFDLNAGVGKLVLHCK